MRRFPYRFATLLSWFVLALWLPAAAQERVRMEPVLLVASPALQDPNFAETVVLVVFPEHGGPTGVILNRPTRIEWKEAFPDDAQLRALQEPIYFGGPVQYTALWFLFRAAAHPGKALSVLDDLYLSSDAPLLERSLARKGAVERFFVGYAGWSPAQLEMEIAQGAWYVLPADLDAVLKMKPESMWRLLLGRARAVKT